MVSMQRHPANTLENRIVALEAKFADKKVGDEFLEALVRFDEEVSDPNNARIINNYKDRIQKLNYKIIKAYADTFSSLANQRMGALGKRLDAAKSEKDFSPETWAELAGVANLQDAIAKHFELKIVTEQDAVKRQILIERCINIAWKLIKINHDYFSAQAIVIALDQANTGVKRLVDINNLSKRAQDRLEDIRDKLPASTNTADIKAFRARVAKKKGRKIIGNFTDITKRAAEISGMIEIGADNKTLQDKQAEYKKQDIEEFAPLYTEPSKKNLAEETIATDLVTELDQREGANTRLKNLDERKNTFAAANNGLVSLEQNYKTQIANGSFVKNYNKLIESLIKKLNLTDLRSLDASASLDKDTAENLLRNLRGKIEESHAKTPDEQGYRDFENWLYKQSIERLHMGEEINIQPLELMRIAEITKPSTTLTEQVAKTARSALATVVGAIPNPFRSASNIDEISNKDFDNTVAAIHGMKNPADQLDLLESILCRATKKQIDEVQHRRLNLIHRLHSSLTELSRYYFSHLDSKELGNFKTESADTPLGHRMLASYFNTVANLVQHSILHDVNPNLSAETNILRRAITMERWVEIMQRCVNNNDMNTALAINAAFRSSNIARLHQSFAAMSKDAKEFLANFAKIDADPYKVTTARRPSLIPYHGSYAGQLALASKDARTQALVDELTTVHESIVSPLTPRNMNPFQKGFSRAVIASVTTRISPSANKGDDAEKYQAQLEEIVKIVSELKGDFDNIPYKSEEDLQLLSDEAKMAETETPKNKKRKIPTEHATILMGYAKMDFAELVAIYTNYKNILKNLTTIDQYRTDLKLDHEIDSKIKYWKESALALATKIDLAIVNRTFAGNITDDIEALKKELKLLRPLLDDEAQGVNFRNLLTTMETIVMHFRALKEPFKNYSRRFGNVPLDAAPIPVAEHPLQTESSKSTSLPLKKDEPEEQQLDTLANDIREFEKLFVEPSYKDYDKNVRATLEKRYIELLEIQANNLAAEHKEEMTPKSHGPGLFSQPNPGELQKFIADKINLISGTVRTEILMSSDNMPLVLERYIRLMTLAYNQKDLLTAASIHAALNSDVIKNLVNLWKSITATSRTNVAKITERLTELSPEDIAKHKGLSPSIIMSFEAGQISAVPKAFLDRPVFHEGIFESDYDNEARLAADAQEIPVSDIIFNNRLGTMLRNYPDVSTEAIKLKQPTPRVDSQKPTIDDYLAVIKALDDLHDGYEKLVAATQGLARVATSPTPRR